MSTLPWSMTRLDAVADIVTGSTPATSDRSNYGQEYMFVSPADIGKGKFVRSTIKNLSEVGYSRTRHVPKGSVLFVCIGSTIGKVGIAGDDLATNQQINALIPSHAVDSDFLFYAASTLSGIVRNQAGEQAVPLVSKAQFSRFEIPTPPLVEQKRIASTISDADRLIESLERLISKKQAIKQGMMQELLTGRTRLPGFNRPWHEKLLGDLTRIKTGSRNNQDKFSSGAYPFFVRSQTVERIDTYSYSGEAVLIPGEGGIGEIFHYINGCHEVHQRVYRISDFSGISGKFAFYYLQQFFKDHALRNTVKATVDSIRLPIIQSFKMTIPGSIDEQTAIAALLDDTSSEIDALERRLESARNIKQGMMQELLSGRTRLSVQEVAP